MVRPRSVSYEHVALEAFKSLELDKQLIQLGFNGHQLAAAMELDENTLWHTYTMLTDLEALFHSLKSELGMRPVFHQITKRVTGHLFISVLAYHLVHSIRYQLTKASITSSWFDLNKQLAGQNRVTISMQCKNNDVIHIRKSTRPEPRQQKYILLWK